MRIVLCKEYGGPSALKVEERDIPSPKPGEVVVAVKAVGLGYVDTLMIAGRYQMRTPPPFIPCTQLVGRITALGDGVQGLQLGQRVAVMCQGALAEYVSVPTSFCTELPDAIPDSVAAYPVPYLAAIYGLQDCGRLQPKETVLVLGAAGAVGTASIHVTKVLGGIVIAAAATAEKRDFCLSQGADYVIDYTQPNWHKGLKKLTRKGVDVIYDPVGGEFSEAAFRAIAPGGRLLVVGFAAGDIPKMPLNLIMLKRAAVVGVDFGGFSMAQTADAASLQRQLMEWIVQGKIIPQTGSIYPMEETSLAFDDIIRRRTRGSVIIQVSQVDRK